MNLKQIEYRVERLESEVATLRASLDQQRAIQGVGRGLKSKAAGKSLPARSAFASLRKDLLGKGKAASRR